ncbi:hypothetical protein DEJ46_23425 [Streptomyces venezuelae]|uniref:Uncharacterized protein n=2 Tax=Streptomyces TaxID=1883 RepID=A0A5P2AXN8_STRVZ|nr:hypothetical protein DEJ46_23425 [Streptomyces venezuelae]
MAGERLPDRPDVGDRRGGAGEATGGRQRGGERDPAEAVVVQAGDGLGRSGALAERYAAVTGTGRSMRSCRTAVSVPSLPPGRKEPAPATTTASAGPPAARSSPASPASPVPPALR